MIFTPNREHQGGVGVAGVIVVSQQQAALVPVVEEVSVVLGEDQSDRNFAKYNLSNSSGTEIGLATSQNELYI